MLNSHNCSFWLLTVVPHPTHFDLFRCSEEHFVVSTNLFFWRKSKERSLLVKNSASNSSSSSNPQKAKKVSFCVSFLFYFPHGWKSGSMHKRPFNFLKKRLPFGSKFGGKKIWNYMLGYCPSSRLKFVRIVLFGAKNLFFWKLKQIDLPLCKFVYAQRIFLHEYPHRKRRNANMPYMLSKIC